MKFVRCCMFGIDWWRLLADSCRDFHVRLLPVGPWLHEPLLELALLRRDAFRTAFSALRAWTWSVDIQRKGSSNRVGTWRYCLPSVCVLDALGFHSLDTSAPAIDQGAMCIHKRYFLSRTRRRLSHARMESRQRYHSYDPGILSVLVVESPLPFDVSYRAK